MASLLQQDSNVKLDQLKCYICTLTAGIGMTDACLTMDGRSENNNNNNKELTRAKHSLNLKSVIIRVAGKGLLISPY